ncbi:MBL fold metallo-hydrolase [Pacificimonas sp. WHA3]|uniref:MBL fold metallo-hydrolase n=1 Tax=Pacificimonas pallii TaxID=2827236 RepID=A0ABS6SBJ2_9SPHN|nr:MBL fold metallo-hydrolase [Pacificimonas pallii]MBV7255788.1 MBL fold metallo-hydrolase [Pacificimonas pallii]
MKKVKHLLWGDWVKITAYDYRTAPENPEDSASPPPTLDHDDLDFIESKLAGMVPVRVRGRSGYMHAEDLGEKQLLEVVFVDVGQGDGVLLVTPDDRKYVIDAGVGDNMCRYLEWRFAGFKGAVSGFDGVILTHPDKDHYFGVSHLVANENFRAAHIWHNGIVERFAISAAGRQSSASDLLLGPRETVGGKDKQDYLTGLIEDDAALSAFLSNRKHWVSARTGRAKQYPDLLNRAQTAVDASGERRFPDIAMLSTEHGERFGGRVYLPGFAPDSGSACTIQIIGPVVEPTADGKPRLRTFADKAQAHTTSMNSGKTKNGHSVLLKLIYGRFSLLFGGDLNSPAEMFLLEHYTGLPVYEPADPTDTDVVQAARPIFGADVAKACHHGSGDFTDRFLAAINAAATIISSGDEESHGHPRSDTLGAVGHHGRGERSLVFSTELARSAPEYLSRKDSPWFQGANLQGRAQAEPDPVKRAALQAQADEKLSTARKRNVTVYGSINLRSDGERVVIAYMLEKPSDSRRWDVYTLEGRNDGPLHYRSSKHAADGEKKRRKSAATST